MASRYKTNMNINLTFEEHELVALFLFSLLIAHRLYTDKTLHS